MRSAFLVFHYPGSLEAFLFRKDPRSGVRTEAQYLEKYSNETGAYVDDSARSWIENFVKQVGLDQAQSLLSKAGVVEALPSKPL